MALNEAAAFMERCAGDEGFRAAAYQTEGPGGFLAWVRESGYSFNRHELEDAARRMRLQARDEGEAAFVEELKQWYAFLSGGLDSSDLSSDPCDPLPCASCASAGNCSSGGAGAVGSKAAVRPGSEA